MNGLGIGVSDGVVGKYRQMFSRCSRDGVHPVRACERTLALSPFLSLNENRSFIKKSVDYINCTVDFHVTREIGDKPDLLVGAKKLSR